MPLVPLSVLVAPETQNQALTTLLSIASQLGLTTTAWQPLGMIRTTFATLAQVIAQFTSLVSYQAQGGYASYASQMPGNGSTYVDSNGFLTTWMDLVSTQVFNVPRIQASYATGTLPIANSSLTATQSGGAGTLHATNPTSGATYTNTQPYFVPVNSVAYIPFQADQPGAFSTSGQGTVLQLTTPITGCTVQALTASWVGVNAETNAALLVRCINKLGSLSPNGAKGALKFVAQSLPQTIVASNVPPYSVSQPITRVGLILNLAVGYIYGYLANANGPAPAGDVSAVAAAVSAFATPNMTLTLWFPCTTFTQNITCTAYVPAAAGLTSAQVQTAAANAIAIYNSNMPVGGVTTTIPNQYPRDALITAISQAIIALSPAYAQNISVAMSQPTADGTMLATDVPAGTVTCSTTFT